jgi:hypothetical protein
MFHHAETLCDRTIRNYNGKLRSLLKYLEEKHPEAILATEQNFDRIILPLSIEAITGFMGEIVDGVVEVCILDN